MFKFNKAAAQNRAENRANACTGHDQFVRPPVPEKKVKHIMKKLHKQSGLKRSNSAIEFDVSALTAANRRHIYSSNRSASSEQDNSDQSEHSERSPLVSARLDNLAKLFFSKSMPAETGSRDTIDSVLSTRPNIKYQYSALDSGNNILERSPRERAQRERAFNTLQEWVQTSNGRYEIIAHLDDMGSRPSKNWFLVTDATVRTDRLLTLLPLPLDCVAFEDLPANENPKPMLMELLGSLHHPYIYPILDLGFLQLGSNNFACLVTPFNTRGSLKDLIYRAQWNEPWARKYIRKPNGLPVSQVQRLGRQILEALLFLKERGFPLHGHLHSGNVILQNGAARLSGLENGLLGLSSRINAVMWSRSTTELENVDIICFGHLLYEMCTGQEMTTPKPSMRVLKMELEHFPQILDVLGLIFEPPCGVCPSVEDLVLCDLFRSIDLRELRGPCFSTIKPSLSKSTLNLLHAVKKRQCSSLGRSLTEMSSPSTPPSTPRDTRRGFTGTMESFDNLSDSEEGLLGEAIVTGSYRYQQHLQQLQRMQNYHKRQYHSYPQPYFGEHAEFFTNFSEKKENDCQTLEYVAIESSPLHFCENTTTQLDDNIFSTKENRQQSQEEQIESPLSSQPSSIAHQLPIICCNSINDLDTPIVGSSSCRSSGRNESIAVVKQEENDPGNNLAMQSDQLELTGDDESTSNNDSASSSVSETSTQPRHYSSTDPSYAHISRQAAMLATAAPTNAATGAASNHQLTADMCNFKNSKSRRLEYSLKCLKYGRSNPSQDSAFGSLTDNDPLVGSSSFRISSFQSISSPIDEGVEDIIIATTTGGKDTCLELATMPRNLISQDSAISSPCRETSPSNFLNINIDDAMSVSSSTPSSSSGGSASHIRPKYFPVALSPKILVTAVTNSINSSLSSSCAALAHAQHFDPPRILVNDQNSIYSTSPSKCPGTIEVFSQKYRVSSFEDMLQDNKRSPKEKLLKNVNRMAFRSLEEERRIDSAFLPIEDRANSENRVNMQRVEKYKKLTHASFRISETSSQVAVYDNGQNQVASKLSLLGNANIDELQRPATASGSVSTRQTMWRDSKFYRKNRIAKSNDSLLETLPIHSARFSPSSVYDNQYDSSSTKEIVGPNRQAFGYEANVYQGLAVTKSLCANVSSMGADRRYRSSKSEELTGSSDYLRAIDAGKSYSERHLVTLTEPKQTVINNRSLKDGEKSEEEMSLNDNVYGHIHFSRSAQQEQIFQCAKQQQLNRLQQAQQKLTRLGHYPPKQQKKIQKLLPQHANQQKQQLLQQVHQPKHSNYNHFFSTYPNNHFSWSSCSVNSLRATNVRTTSMASLFSRQNLKTSASTAPSLNAVGVNMGETLQASLPYVARSSFFKSVDQFINFREASSGGSGTETASDNSNSSADDSPTYHQTISGAEFSKMFSMHDTQSSECSEEKTPLLDYVEMSPISPSEPEESANEEEKM